MNPLSIFGSYIKLAIAAAILASVIGGYLYVSHLRSEVAAQAGQITDLGSKLSLQNAAVEQMKIDSDARAKVADAALAAARVLSRAQQAKAIVIYKEAPSTPNDLCKSALDLGNEQ